MKTLYILILLIPFWSCSKRPNAPDILMGSLSLDITFATHGTSKITTPRAVIDRLILSVSRNDSVVVNEEIPIIEGRGHVEFEVSVGFYDIQIQGVVREVVKYIGEGSVSVESGKTSPVSIKLQPTSGALGSPGLIAFTTDKDSDSEIYTLDFQSLLSKRLTYNTGRDLSPSWSPDGKKIAFVSGTTFGTEYLINYMNVDGSNRTQLTDFGMNPSFSPTGDKIVFDGGPQRGIYTIDLKEKNIQKLVDEGYDPSWSPRGGKIIFVSERNTNPEIYVMDEDGKNQTRITVNPARDLWPNWSPDGNRIVFMSERDFNWEVYVMNADGSDPVNLTEYPGLDVSPSWSSSGNQIVFSSDRSGSLDLWMADLETGSIIRLTNYPGNEDQPAWAP